MTPGEFVAIALALGAPAHDYRLDTAYTSIQGWASPTSPMMAISTVEMALRNLGVAVTPR